MGLTDSLQYRFEGLEHFRNAINRSPTRSAIFVLWHQDLLMLLGCSRKSGTFGGIKMAALASLSGDGAIIADHLERRGIRTVRGSSARGAAKAAKELMTVLQEGWNLAIAIDGPRGPYKQPKDGPLEMARMFGVPMIPLAARASRELRFGSWDRFRLPMPGSKVSLVIGAASHYPPEPVDDAALFERRKDLARRLHDLEALAAGHVGQPDRYPVERHLKWLRGS